MKLFSRKWLVASLATFMLLLSACGINSKSGDESQNLESNQIVNKPEKITAIVDNTFATYLEKVALEYEKEYGIKVELTTTDYNSLHDKIVTSLAGGGSGVDLVEVDTVWPAEFAAAGFLEPLDKYAGNDIKDKIVPISYEQFIVNGQLVAFPMANEGKFLYYNEKLLKEGGYDAPPKTWDELIAIAKDLKRRGIAKYGIAWSWNQAEALVCDYTLFLNAFGGQYKNADGEWVFYEGAGLQALEFMANA
ncbi:exported hypothetical protein [[Clostridium] ultunense Esp]|nr:exported hypothetical protein [[Clostridium] ultunense Esp]